MRWGIVAYADSWMEANAADHYLADLGFSLSSRWSTHPIGYQPALFEGAYVHSGKDQRGQIPSEDTSWLYCTY